MVKKIFHTFFLFLLTCQPIYSITAEEPALPPSLEKELQLANEQVTTTFMDKFIYMLFLLGLMIALLYIGVWILKRINSTKKIAFHETDTVKIVEKHSLSLKTTLYLVEVFEKQILIAESVNGISVLTEISANVKK